MTREAFDKVIGFDTETVLTRGAHEIFSFQYYTEDPALNASPDHPLSVFKLASESLEPLFTYGTRGAYIVCANAQFDLAAIRDLLHRDSLDILMVYNSQKLIRATIYDQARHRWHVIDVFNILTGRNLAGIGELLGIPKLEKPSFLGEREPTAAEMPSFQQYAIQDAKIAYHAARWIIKELGKLKATLPALTMSLYRKQNPASVWWFRNDPANLELMKRAYHGGRCETFIRGTVFDRVFAYDVRSLYPAVMAEGVYPDLTIQPEEKRDIDLDKEGIAEVTITQEGSVPPLCVKRDVKPRVQRLIFPEGSITDFFTYPELRYLEAHSFGRIGKVKRAWEVRRGPNPFHDFILDLFKRRNDLLLTKDPRQTIYKLLMNSLYGKFAESGTRKEYTFKEGKLTLTDQKQGFTNNTNFLLAAYITAQARLRTHRLMAANDFEDILYVDTDGFLATKHNYATAEGLGFLTDRTTGKPYALTTCIRPKFYILDDAITFRGFPQRISGNLLRAQILKGDVQTTFKQILGLRAAKARRLRPLSEITTIKKFTLGEDLKREYAKHLDNGELISEYVGSQPLCLRES